MRVSPGLSIDEIKGKSKSQEDLKNLTEYYEDQKKVKYIMPAFPVAMAIAKDITIKVKIEQEESHSAKSVVENASSSGGGFLCFSVSSASSSKNSSDSAYHGAHGEHYYIRIPGPQIIGYFLQLVPKDNSEAYQPNFNKDGTSDVIEAFQLYTQAKQLMQSELPQLSKAQKFSEENKPLPN